MNMIIRTAKAVVRGPRRAAPWPAVDAGHAVSPISYRCAGRDNRTDTPAARNVIVARNATELMAMAATAGDDVIARVGQRLGDHLETMLAGVTPDVNEKDQRG